VAWIQLAQDRFQWRVLVNKVMNFRVVKKGGGFIDKLSGN